jgi:acyl carrier protein
VASTEPHATQWRVPASYAQERIWFASQLARDTPVYHVVDRIPLAYPLSAEQLRAILALLCDRHEPLRTSLHLDEDGELTQVVHGRVEPPVPVVDLSGEPEDARPARLDELTVELDRAALPLDRAPLWRAALVRWDRQHWRLVFVAHHAVVDAASLVNLRAELDVLCEAELAGRPARLPELRIQYADYAVWQRGWLSGARLDRLLAFWQRTLAGLPAVHGVPTDRPRPVERSFAGDNVVVPLGAEPAAAELARRTGTTPFMVLFAAYAGLLHRLSGQQDVVIGLPVAGRDQPDLQPLVGMFVNVIVIRVDTSGDPTFGGLLGRVRRTLLDAWDHQDMPFQTLVEALAGHRRPGVPPLYQIAFNYVDLGFSRRPGIADSTEDDLALEIANDEARLEYNTALFDRGTARRIAEGYRQVLAAVLADPELRLSALPVRPPAAEPEPRRPADRPGYVPPRTAAEELVASVWAEVLNVERVGALDDFFELGGHSLLALRVIVRLSAAAGVELTIQAFFADTTVAGVAAEIERLVEAELAEVSEEDARRLAAGEGPAR